jgi:hypothetical protein
MKRKVQSPLKDYFLIVNLIGGVLEAPYLKAIVS